MARPRGLRGLGFGVVALSYLRGLLAACALVSSLTFLVLLLSGSAVNVRVLHPWALALIIVTSYAWSLFPRPVSAPMSGAVLTVLLVGALARRSALLGADLLLCVVLLIVVGVQQSRRWKRLQRLQQQVDDVAEELRLKQQALQNAQGASGSLQRKRARYHDLQMIARELSQVVESEAIGRLAVERGFDLIGKAEACLLYLLDRDRQELALVASQKAPGVPAIREKQGDQFEQYIVRTQRPLLVNEVRRDFRFNARTAGDRPIASVIACPLRASPGIDGVLRLDSAKPNTFTQDDLRLLDIFLSLVSAAMANAHLFAQTQQLALTDGLTGLYRRQPFLEQLNRDVARAVRAREPLAMLMLDIDDFKRHNDTLGHPAGDRILKTIADVMCEHVPPHGMCARYGGEEFAVLIPKAGRAEAAGVADRIRQQISSAMRPDGHEAGAVTVSIGVAIFPEDAQSETELIRRADQRLYQAKRAGKNQVVAG